MPKFPPLYECSRCGGPVKVTPVEGQEPIKTFKCGHDDAVIWANRKVTLRGKGKISVVKKTQIAITLTVRQILSTLTGRSI